MKRYSWGVWSIILLFITKCSEKPILQSFLCKTEAEGHLLPSLFLQINFRLGAFGQKSTRSNTFEHRSFDESCFLYIFNLCLIFFFSCLQELYFWAIKQLVIVLLYRRISVPYRVVTSLLIFRVRLHFLHPENRWYYSGCLARSPSRPYSIMEEKNV